MTSRRSRAAPCDLVHQTLVLRRLFELRPFARHNSTVDYAVFGVTDSTNKTQFEHDTTYLLNSFGSFSLRWHSKSSWPNEDAVT